MVKKSSIKLIIVVLLLFAAALFAYLAYVEHKPFAEAKTRHDALVEVVAETVHNDQDPMNRNIDFGTLKNINPDVIGWVYAPQVGIDEPILKGTDNEFYLTHDFEKTYSPLGSVFTWSDANPELEDSHVFLFGHNMISGQIFGKLSLFKDESFMLDNPSVYIYTPHRVKRLEAVECTTCRVDDEIFQGSQEKQKSKRGQVFTLVTCEGYENTPMRLIVNCRLVEEKIIVR